MSRKNKSLALFIGLCMIFTMSGCGEKPIKDDKSDAIPINMLITGFVNLATNENDPYRKWVRDNYNLDINLVSVSDLSGAAVVEFASNDKPDIVIFNNINEYDIIAKQRVLVDDYNKYLDKMPNFKKIMEEKDLDNPQSDSIAGKMMTKDGKLKAMWTLPEVPTWSLKIREDWANEYRAGNSGGITSDGKSYPAGSKATNGGKWQPETPEDLINFARWIKNNKDGCYAFTSAGSGSTLGTLGNWLPLMWSSVAEVPYGIYVKGDGEVNFSVTDGTHKFYIDYLKQINDEKLIDPSWFIQSWENKTKTKQGLIGIEWYPGSITSETQSFHPDKDTVNWWKTYPLPCAEGYDAGYMPVEGYVGKIVCVSKKAAMDKKKMDAICGFFNDCFVYPDGDKYVRPKAYDALRWGVGVEEGYKYQQVEGSDYLYLDVSDTDDYKFYRNTTAGAGAWDWGAWLATSRDGIIQGNSHEVSAVTKKIIEHNYITSQMKMKTQVGSSLNLDSSLVKTLNVNQIHWEYNYVVGNKVDDYNIFLDKWKNVWGGDNILNLAKHQFIELGIIK